MIPDKAIAEIAYMDRGRCNRDSQVPRRESTSEGEGIADLPPKTDPVGTLVLGSTRGAAMGRRKHTPEQIINKLTEAEVAIAEGNTVAEASRRIGVTQHTFYR